MLHLPLFLTGNISGEFISLQQTLAANLARVSKLLSVDILFQNLNFLTSVVIR